MRQCTIEVLESRQLLSASLVNGLLATSAPQPAVLAASTLAKYTGTYATATKTGTITYQVTRVFYRLGTGGWVTVDGKRYWGVMASTNGVTGLTWYYGSDSTGPEAGRATLTLQSTGVYSGSIQFTSKTGAITGTGTVSLKLQ